MSEDKKFGTLGAMNTVQLKEALKMIAGMANLMEQPVLDDRSIDVAAFKSAFSPDFNSLPEPAAETLNVTLEAVDDAPEDIKIPSEKGSFTASYEVVDPDHKYDQSTYNWSPSPSPQILIPQVTIPDNHVHMASKIKNATKFVPIGKTRKFVKPCKGEGYEHYMARCNNDGGVPLAPPPFKSKENTAEQEEAIANLVKLSRFLLKEVEEGKLSHISDKKTLKQLVFEKVQNVKAKVEDVKKEVFFSLVNRAQKVLNIK